VVVLLDATLQWLEDHDVCGETSTSPMNKLVHPPWMVDLGVLALDFALLLCHRGDDKERAALVFGTPGGDIAATCGESHGGEFALSLSKAEGASVRPKQELLHIEWLPSL
jgi:hypothetical protein